MGNIQFISGDITKVTTDAIVNAANNSLLGGGGVDGAIHRAAGSGLLAECKKTGGCPTGEARLTNGYKLPARYVIHTVGPVYKGDINDPELLKNCYLNSLSIAFENGFNSIAFPAISCGVYGYPVEDASKIAIKTTLDFLSEKNNPFKVIFVLFSKTFLNIYKENYSKILKNS